MEWYNSIIMSRSDLERKLRYTMETLVVAVVLGMCFGMSLGWVSFFVYYFGW